VTVPFFFHERKVTGHVSLDMINSYAVAEGIWWIQRVSLISGAGAAICTAVAVARFNGRG
jgi:hypothetical protein